MYKYVLNSVVKISLMFKYYAIILRGGGVFSWTCCTYDMQRRPILSDGRNCSYDAVLSQSYTQQWNSTKTRQPCSVCQYLISMTNKELLMSIVGLHCHNNGMTRIDQQRTSTVPQHLLTATNVFSQLPLSTDW